MVSSRFICHQNLSSLTIGRCASASLLDRKMFFAAHPPGFRWFLGEKKQIKFILCAFFPSSRTSNRKIDEKYRGGGYDYMRVDNSLRIDLKCHQLTSRNVEFEISFCSLLITQCYRQSDDVYLSRDHKNDSKLFAKHIGEKGARGEINL